MVIRLTRPRCVIAARLPLSRVVIGGKVLSVNQARATVNPANKPLNRASLATCTAASPNRLLLSLNEASMVWSQMTNSASAARPGLNHWRLPLARRPGHETADPCPLQETNLPMCRAHPTRAGYGILVW
jgi:hypothetical protein